MSKQAVSPLAPFEDWPRDTSFDWGWLWFAPVGNTLVTQVTVSEVEPAHVHSLHDAFARLSAAGFERLHPGHRILNDWRAVKKLKPGVRETWLSRKRGSNSGFLRCEASIAVNTSPLMRMAMQAAAVSIQLAIGQRMVTIISNIDEEVERCGLQRPPSHYLANFLAKSQSVANATVIQDGKI